MFRIRPKNLLKNKLWQRMDLGLALEGAYCWGYVKLIRIPELYKGRCRHYEETW